MVDELTDSEGMDRVGMIWLQWATNETELAARIAEVLEATGRAVIRSVDEVANDKE